MFSFFKKRKEKRLLDLTEGKAGKEEIPIPKELREKLKAQAGRLAENSKTSAAEKIASNDDSSSPGGFFSGFFDSRKDYASASSESENSTSIEAKIQDLSNRFSKTIQRIELLERKIERLERR